MAFDAVETMGASSDTDVQELRHCVVQALRAEFDQLRSSLLQEVRTQLQREVVSPDLDKQSEPSLSGTVRTLHPFEDTLRSNRSEANNLGARKFMPLRSFRVGEMAKWLEEVDEVQEQHLPARRKHKAEGHSDTMASGNIFVRVHPAVPEEVQHGDGPRIAADAEAEDSPTSEDQDQEKVVPPKHQSSKFMSRGPSQSSSRKDPIQTMLGLSPQQKGAEEPELEEASLRQRVARVVRSSAFDAASIILVVTSAALIGLEIDYMARHRTASSLTAFKVLDGLLLAFFAVECGMRLFVYRWRFFRMWGWGWNVFDLTLIITQIIEEIFDKDNVSSTFLLRLTRGLKTLRVLRVVHVMRAAQELRLLVCCIVHSARSFYWSTVLILLMVYIFAVPFAQVVLLWRLDDDTPASTEGFGRLGLWYGSVPRSGLSLFQGLTGGVDWNDLVDPLVEYISPWMGALFFLYISFALLGVMNVVTATFVQNANERAAEVQEAQRVSQASRLFRTLDRDSTGTITLDEIERNLESTEVLEFFRSIDVDVSEARILFDMLDTDRSGAIEFAEFLSGCLRLQSPAKAIDLVLVMRELRQAFQLLEETQEHLLSNRQACGGGP